MHLSITIQVSTYVQEQFPLVQRQWDAVSQFRPQIIHKATMSLREYEATAEVRDKIRKSSSGSADAIQDTCVTLLTLHLLDSRPLTDTLSILLTQRSKALHTMLSWTPEHIFPGSSGKQQRNNGHTSEKTTNMPDVQQATFRRPSVQEVQHAAHAALEVIFRTLTIARRIFQERVRPSMISSALEHIQSDFPDSTSSGSLPVQFQLNTETLLASLPSSGHFLLLPPNLRSYKPYVDPTSSSSCVPQTHFERTLNDWFHKSTVNLQTAVKRWFSDLHSVSEVWRIRSSFLKRINLASDLEEQEPLRLRLVFDDACRERLLGIWKATLRDAGKAFEEQFASIVSALAKGDEIRLTGQWEICILPVIG
jgi:conserved oligomeric Golgi complex subunit 1